MKNAVKALSSSLARLHEKFFKKSAGCGTADKSLSDRGIFVFSNTSEVIAAEQRLKKLDFDVEVKCPPPDLRTGCDMIVLFPLMHQAAVEKALAVSGLVPERIIAATDSLLNPVSLYNIKYLENWVMVRAANMKITIDRRTEEIVNISGGGCPDVPYLAARLTGKRLREAPEPISMGHTLCCYSLQKAFEELKRIMACGL